MNASAASVSIPVSVTGTASSPVTVSYTTANGTAFAPTNYAASTGQVTISSPTNITMFAVPIMPNSVTGSNKTFTVTLSSAANATLGAVTTITVTIVASTIFPPPPPPSLPTVQFVMIGNFANESTGTASISVSLSTITTLPVSVHFATSNGTAIAGINYTATSGTVTFPAGNQNQTFSVPLLRDFLPWPNKSLNLTLSSPSSNATLGTQSSSTLTIWDDDPLPVVTFSPNPLYIPQGGSGSLVASVTPAVAASYLSFDSMNTSIATVAGAFPNLTATGVAGGFTQFRALFNGNVCGTGNVAVVTVAFSTNPLYVAQNGTAWLTATVTPSSAAALVVFSSTDITMANVSGTAPTLTVSGENTAGTTQIQATLGTIILATTNVRVVGVTFTPNPLYVAVGGTASLTATVVPPAAASVVTFDIADSTIATVSGASPTLTVNGIAAGATQLHARVGWSICGIGTVNVIQDGFNWTAPLFFLQ